MPKQQGVLGTTWSEVGLIAEDPGFVYAPATFIESNDALYLLTTRMTGDARPQWSYPDDVYAGGWLFIVCTSEKTSAAFMKLKL